ncbi:MAG: hypothetical protein HFF70_07265 [Oscillospiraceae bacterium]|nr:hypothetical protein [Oscillospiraceae bacterium]
MKISLKRRFLSLLLALALAFTLAPSAFPTEAPPETPPEDQPGVLKELKLSSDAWTNVQEGQKDFELLLEPSASVDLGGVQIKASLEPGDDAEVQAMHVSWSSSDPAITAVSEQENGHSGTVYGKAPGKATVTVTAGSGASQQKCTIQTTVSGIKVSETLAKGITVAENQSKEIKLDTDFFLFGNAASEYAMLSASVVNNKPNVRKPLVSSDKKTVTIEGREAGEATVVLEISSAGYIYKAEFPVTVTSNEQTIEWTEGCSPAKPLKFSALEERIVSKYREVFPGGTFSSIIGLSVPTAQGTMYLGYNSPEDTGAGAGSSMTYYYRTAARGPYIQDLTFVPNPSYTGEKAYIAFTAQGTDSAGTTRTFKGKIEVTLTQEKTDLTVSTKRDTPLKLSSTLFSKSCQEQTGAPLSYVVFTLPPANQGSLYLGYKDEWDYASKVSANEQYKQKQLDDMTFVPAQGFVGTVTVSYAGYSASGSRYNGQLVIQVKQGLDDAITYNGDGAVSFSRYDFEDFCRNETGRELSSVSFTPPPASQGTLYYSWNGLRGSAVTSNDAYGPSQIDRLTFVAADGFHGVVRIPFTGTDRSGETFTGTVEVHIQSVGTTRGDVSYVCAPGQSVKLNLSDFTALCQTLTGQRLHYISFQSLPDFHMGTLYHNRTSSGSIGTRVTTATKYFNSATPYLSNLSFWATESFRGGVEIPFTGCAVSGETFTAILYISSGEGAGSGSSAAVQYTVTSGGSVTFSGKDFDDACRQATNAALSYLRFDLPSSGQGILYYDYRAGSTPKALNPATDLYRSGEVSIDRVTFVPAKSFAGIASVPFTAWAIDGTEYRGMAEITVRSEAALGGLVRYQTGGAPVHISAADIQSAAGEQPSSLRLTGLPNASQGKLYYQYAGPTQYSWQGNTTTEYSLYGDPSVSNLTFVPKAGYTGTVEIPYAAATSSGGYAGTIRITVSASNSSVNFDDLDGYSAQTKAAVDYLSSIGVVNGTGYRTYEPGASIRRGDFCVMLSRAFQFNVGGSGGGFTDVPAGAYYASAVNDLYALGIVNGVGGGRFQPSATLSRQDAALMIQRTLNQAGIEIPDGNSAALAAYSDRGQVADYARGAVAGLAQLGLLPTRNSRLSPKANLTRADMALLLHRAMTQ